LARAWRHCGLLKPLCGTITGAGVDMLIQAADDAVFRAEIS
jgi:hypothetical protein